jgi:glycosyltransferase involved in cell wall biosynthesis
VITFDFFPLIGGIGRHTFLMFSALQQADLLFFSPAENRFPNHIRITCWPVRLFKQAGVSLWLFLRAGTIIARHGLDCLNVHAGPGGVLLPRRLKVPVIVTCHHTYRQQCHYLKSQFWKRIFIPFEQRTYRLADKIICVSDATRSALVERYGIPDAKIVTVYNAVDTVKFHPIDAPKIPGTIVYLGRLDGRKGIEFLIRSMPLVRKQLPHALLLVGGTGALLEKMKDLVKELRLEQNVRFLGFVPDEELNALYNQGECVVVPSVFEGFGITVIEALAAGTRVVGSDSDGIREILTGGASGTLARYGDRGALARAIVSELESPRSAPRLDPKYRVEQFQSGYLEAFGRGV